MADRERLRATFNSAARRYHQARPDYPDALLAELIRLADLQPGDRLLEVGCGTGKATAPLARRGFRLIGVELGPELAAVARANLAGFDGRPGRHRGIKPGSRPSAALTWCSRRPPGTGSTRSRNTGEPGSCCGRAATSPSGPLRT